MVNQRTLFKYIDAEGYSTTTESSESRLLRISLLQPRAPDEASLGFTHDTSV